MRVPARRWGLLAALAASVAAAGWVGGGQAPAPAQEPAAPEPPAPPRPAAAAVDLARLQERAAPGKIGELFPPRDWQPRAARRAAPAPPEPERAPPLPFVYMGRMIEDGAVTVFLAAGGRSIVAREGEVIDGRYRVDEIGEGALQLTYLPLGQAQRLGLGSTP
jgi:hypothetical protein